MVDKLPPQSIENPDDTDPLNLSSGLKRVNDLPDMLNLKPDPKHLYDLPLTPADIAYLISLYPYVTIADEGRVYIGPNEQPKRMHTKNGWRMFVYESAVCLGTNYLAAEHYQQEHDIKDTGTLIKQGHDAVTEMIEYVKTEKAWEAIRIVYGNYSLQRMVWIMGVALNYRISGFYPEEEDERIRQFLEKIRRRTFYPGEMGHI